MAQLKDKRTENDNLVLASVHHMKNFRITCLCALPGLGTLSLYIAQSSSDQACGVHLQQRRFGT